MNGALQITSRLALDQYGRQTRLFFLNKLQICNCYLQSVKLFIKLLYITKKSLSTFWETYALVIFNRNKEKDSEKLSAPVSEIVLEYEKRFQVERQREFIAVNIVSPLTRILIKVLSFTFICLLYCRMHIYKTQHNSKQYRHNLERSFDMVGCKSGNGAPCILSKTPRWPVSLGTRKTHCNIKAQAEISALGKRWNRAVKRDT